MPCLAKEKGFLLIPHGIRELCVRAFVISASHPLRGGCSNLIGNRYFSLLAACTTSRVYTVCIPYILQISIIADRYFFEEYRYVAISLVSRADTASYNNNLTTFSIMQRINVFYQNAYIPELPLTRYIVNVFTAVILKFHVTTQAYL